MNQSDNRDYSIFTKKELVDFMKKYGWSFGYTSKPFDILVEERQKQISLAIEKNIEEGKRFAEMAKRCTGVNRLGIVMELKKNHEQWKKLDREYQRLDKLRFLEMED